MVELDIQTIQAIGALVNQIGLPATVGVILVIASWNLVPVLAEYLRSRIAVNHATAKQIGNGTSQKS